MTEPEIQTESRTALRELIAMLEEVDRRWAGSEWLVDSVDDVAGAHRALMHLLQAGLFSHFEDDPTRPDFRRIVAPHRKMTGDNPDAIYYEAPVTSSLAYRVRGRMAGAVYMSITTEIGDHDGGMSEATGGCINDGDIDIDADGSFEIVVGGPAQEGNWLALPERVVRLTTRHYFEEERYVAADAHRDVGLTIEPIDPTPIPPPPSDESVAAGIRRVANFVRSRTLEMGRPGDRERPAFAGTTPNEFPPPVPPGDFALSFIDAAYSLAPYLIGPDEALVLSGRWPECRAGYVCVWNRWQQTLDYVNRPVGLNRARTQLEPDGSFRMIVAHADPGVPNWIDTEGRTFGILFWRFVLPDGPIETPRAEVVPFSQTNRR